MNWLSCYQSKYVCDTWTQLGIVILPFSRCFYQQVRNNFEESEDNLSVGSFGLYRNNLNVSPALSVTQYKYDPGNILRHTTLKAVSAQLRSASVRLSYIFAL